MYSLLVSLALALPAADTVAVEAVLPEVSVVASRLGVLPAEAPARVTILTSEAITASASRSVADLLEARSSLFVRRYGPAGLASVSFRGTGASQTLVLLDGHRIADPQLGQLDFSLLPTLLLERVEILHGAGSALHGTDGIGGVVDLRTMRPERPRLELATTVGAFDEYGLSARAAVGRGRLRALVAAEASAVEGDFPYFDRTRGTSGEVVRRTGADAEKASLFARVEADLGRTSAFAAVWAGMAERGIPGSIGAPVDARQADRHVRAWGGTSTRYAWGTLRLGGLVQHAALRYNDEEGRTTLASAEVEARAPIGRWVLAGGLTSGLAAANHPRLAEDAREVRSGAFLSAIGDFGALLVYPALRADVYLRTGGAARTLTAWSPRLGFNWKPLAAIPLHLKAGTGTAFRVPTFNDRFWRFAEPSAPGGDPDLRPERGWNADAGAYLSAGAVRAEVTLYGAWLRDQIVWQPAGGGFWAPLNLARTRTRGFEATAEVLPRRLRGWYLGGGIVYALTDARDRSSPGSASYDQPLRYVPRHQVKGHLSLSRDLGSRSMVRLNGGARYVSARPVRTDGSLFEPGYLVTDLRVGGTYRFDPQTASLTLGIDNLFNTDYAVLRGYPMPPRHARFRLHLTF